MCCIHASPPGNSTSSPAATCALQIAASWPWFCSSLLAAHQQVAPAGGRAALSGLGRCKHWRCCRMVLLLLLLPAATTLPALSAAAVATTCRRGLRIGRQHVKSRGSIMAGGQPAASCTVTTHSAEAGRRRVLAASWHNADGVCACNHEEQLPPLPASCVPADSLAERCMCACQRCEQIAPASA
jgi:hypothetical protein